MSTDTPAAAPTADRSLQMLGFELAGVIADVEQGGGFDAVCLETIKRVRAALSAPVAAPSQDMNQCDGCKQGARVIVRYGSIDGLGDYFADAQKAAASPAAPGGLTRIEALEAALTQISAIENKLFGPDWEEIDEARAIAIAALASPSEAPAATPAAPELNQCDGCKQGAELRNGLHYDRHGKAFMGCQRDKYAAPVAAQPAASGVDAQWVEQLANKARRAWAINPPSIGVLTQEMREIDEALRTHLSTALTGAAKEETNG